MQCLICDTVFILISIFIPTSPICSPPEETEGREKDGHKERSVLGEERWTLVSQTLQPYVRPYGDSQAGRLDFYHRSLSKAVKKRYRVFLGGFFLLFLSHVSSNFLIKVKRKRKQMNLWFIVLHIWSKVCFYWPWKPVLFYFVVVFSIYHGLLDISYCLLMNYKRDELIWCLCIMSRYMTVSSEPDNSSGKKEKSSSYFFWHRKLAEFFRDHKDSVRMVEEYPNHLACLGERWPSF